MDDGGIHFHLQKPERHLERRVDDAATGGCPKDFIGPPSPADLRKRASQEFNMQAPAVRATEPDPENAAEITVEPRLIVEKPPTSGREVKAEVFITIPFDLKR